MRKPVGAAIISRPPTFRNSAFGPNRSGDVPFGRLVAAPTARSVHPGPPGKVGCSPFRQGLWPCFISTHRDFLLNTVKSVLQRQLFCPLSTSTSIALSLILYIFLFNTFLSKVLLTKDNFCVIVNLLNERRDDSDGLIYTLS